MPEFLCRFRSPIAELCEGINEGDTTYLVMNQKYWQILLRSWRRQGRDGFSIPYVIGSQLYLPATHSMQTIGDLISDIVENNGETILLKYCFGIGDLILEIRDESNKNIPGRFPPFKKSTQSSLYVSNFIDDLGDSIEEMIPILTERYQPHLDAGSYSINEGKRGHYSLEEREFIRSCFSIYSA